jgi:hypothetical protein
VQRIALGSGHAGLEVGQGPLLHLRPAPPDPRVVHQDIDRPKIGIHGPERLDNCRLVADVAGVGTSLTGVLGRPRGGLTVDVHHRHVPALAAERQRHRLAEPGTAAGDKDHPALEPPAATLSHPILPSPMCLRLPRHYLGHRSLGDRLVTRARKQRAVSVSPATTPCLGIPPGGRLPEGAYAARPDPATWLSCSAPCCLGNELQRRVMRAAQNKQLACDPNDSIGFSARLVLGRGIGFSTRS